MSPPRRFRGDAPGHGAVSGGRPRVRRLFLREFQAETLADERRVSITQKRNSTLGSSIGVAKGKTNGGETSRLENSDHRFATNTVINEKTRSGHDPWKRRQKFAEHTDCVRRCQMRESAARRSRRRARRVSSGCAAVSKSFKKQRAHGTNHKVFVFSRRRDGHSIFSP